MTIKRTGTIRKTSCGDNLSMPRSVTWLPRPIVVVAALFVILLAGCLQQMENQPRYETQESTNELPVRFHARHKPEHTVPISKAHVQARLNRSADNRQADANDDSKISTALIENLSQSETSRSKLLAQGKRTYEVSCVPCHGLLGGGQGMAVLRGYPTTPSFHTNQSREKTLQQLYATTTEGTQLMPSYQHLLSEEERWSTVAYIRALQLSQHTPYAELDESEKKVIQAQTSENR